MEGSPDLLAAETVAEAVGANHFSFTFTVQEGLDALDDVIRHLETYDVTTIRASTPMYLMARQISRLGIKMVLSGEGSDEMFGGYLYFHHAPNAAALHEECVRKLHDLHFYDCLRANKSTAAWGVETRVPFLDCAFVEYVMGLDPAYKLPTSDRIEKWCLRKAFEGVLPDAVLWRQKEQFSDGVGYTWIDSLREYASTVVTATQMAAASAVFPFQTPRTAEAFLYRSLFARHFPSREHTVKLEESVACSTATAAQWLDAERDCSGRVVVDVHRSASATKCGV